MPSARWDHTAAVVNDTIYVIGGVTGTVEESTNLPDVLMFAPESGVWINKQSLAEAKRGA